MHYMQYLEKVKYESYSSKKMHTEFWIRISAFGVRRFGEKKPIVEFGFLGSETQIQKRKEK
jgi:hypothetical protein